MTSLQVLFCARGHDTISITSSWLSPVNDEWRSGLSAGLSGHPISPFHPDCVFAHSTNSGHSRNLLPTLTLIT
jgi:hypothetical protein